ncbi:MAG: alpha/beta hydrolase [Clostridium sp.]
MLNYDYLNNNKLETIVLLHGFGGNANCFKKQIDDLKSHFNILMIDMHVHGKSKNMHLGTSEEFTLRKIAFDINTLLEKLHIPQIHFMSLSLGTMVATVYAYHYPKKVLSLLNIGAIIKLRPIDHFLLRLVYKHKRFIPRMFIYYVAGFVVMPLNKHRKARKMNHEDFFMWTKLMMNFESLYPAEKLNFNFPTLYASGAYDRVFVEEVKKYCDNSKYSYLCILKDAGHICNIGDPECFNKLMLEFYQDIFELPLVVNAKF